MRIPLEKLVKDISCRVCVSFSFSFFYSHMIRQFGIINRKGMQWSADRSARRPLTKERRKHREKKRERERVMDDRIISSTRLCFASRRMEMCIIRTRVSKQSITRFYPTITIVIICVRAADILQDSLRWVSGDQDHIKR